MKSHWLKVDGSTAESKLKSLHKLKFYPSVLLLMIKISQSALQELDSYCKIWNWLSRDCSDALSPFCPHYAGRCQSLKAHQMFSVRTACKEMRTKQSPFILDLCFEKLRTREITWLMWRHRSRKAPFSISSPEFSGSSVSGGSPGRTLPGDPPLTEEPENSGLEIAPFSKCFVSVYTDQKVLSRCFQIASISSNNRLVWTVDLTEEIKAAFSNLSGVMWTMP